MSNVDVRWRSDRMLYWGKLICWILLLRRTVSCSAAPRFKIFVWPVTIWAQTLQNIATNNEESGYSKRTAFSNICDNQPTSVMSDEGSSSTTTTTFGWSSSRKVVRRFAVWANDSKMDGWAVGHFLDILADTKKFSFSQTQRDEVCCWKLTCLPRHSTKPFVWAWWVLRYHAPVPLPNGPKGRLDSTSFFNSRTGYVIRKCEVLSLQLQEGFVAAARLAAVEAQRPFFFFFFWRKGGLRATCKPREVRAWLLRHC